MLLLQYYVYLVYELTDHFFSLIFNLPLPPYFIPSIPSLIPSSCSQGSEYPPICRPQTLGFLNILKNTVSSTFAHLRLNLLSLFLEVGFKGLRKIVDSLFVVFIARTNQIVINLFTISKFLKDQQQMQSQIDDYVNISK